MKCSSCTVLFFLGLIVLAACASTAVTQQTPMVNPGLARPNQIWVYDFVANPAEVPADSSTSGALSAPSTPLTAEELETGRQLCASIVKRSGGRYQCDGESRPCRPDLDRRRNPATAYCAVT